MIFAWFQAQAVKLLGGLSAVSLLGLAICWIGWGRANDRADEALERVGAEETRHAVTRASLEALQADLAAMIAEGALRRERASTALLEAREAGEAVREAAQETGRTDWRGQEGL